MMGDLETGLREKIRGEVRFDEVARMLYRTDASIYEVEPLGLVVPSNEEDVVELVRLAAEHEVSILPRGGGTSLAGQSVGASIHVDFSKYMNQILELNVEERWVRVQPGVVLDELNAYLRPHGLLFGPDVSTSSRANIGGMIGNNSCGARSIIYGKTIDHVLGLRGVLADGTIVEMGPVDQDGYEAKAAQQSLEGDIYRQVHALARDNEQEIRSRFPSVMRRVSGYNLDEFIVGERPFDLSKIVVGSEGTLCAIVEAKLSLEPMPACKGLVAIHFADLNESLEANIEVLETGPASVELTDRLLLDLTGASIEHAPRRRFLQGDPEALLFVEYYADTEIELATKMDQLEERLGQKGMGYAFVRALSAADQNNMWAMRKAGLGLLMGMKGEAKPTSGVEDICVPPQKLPEFVRRVQAAMARHGVDACYYGHCSVGVLHIRPILNMKEESGVGILRALEDEMSDMALEYGGAMSAEHGDGLARSEWIPKMFGEQVVRLFEAVKDAFDAKGIMNPGKIVRAPRMDENLRYGEGYRTQKLETFFSFDNEGGFQEAAELCSGVGQCRKRLVGTMCPSYMATLDEEHSTRGRANALRAALSGHLPGGLAGEHVHRVMDLCLECKACKTECPSNVDMAKLKYEFLAHYHGEHGYPLRSYIFGYIADLARWGSAFAPLSNWIAGSGLNRWFLDRFLGIDRRRKLPHFASQPFSKWFFGRERKPAINKGQVVLFNDTFAEYEEPQIAMAATIILECAGYEVVLVENKVCCGRPLISKGFLEQARVNAQHNIAALLPYAERGVPIVGIEPSCILSLSDDYLDLVGGEDAKKVAERVYMLENFLVEEARDGNLGLEFKATRRRLLLHGHCHQKALVGTAATLEVLRMPPQFEVEEIDSGCCGMAGSFGYEKEHFEVSRQVGQERLFDVIEAAEDDVEIVAVGTSCRHQIADFTARKARHWTEVFVEAL
ncbi:MAG: FAD/FMN-containing dehydrogenase/Fe-S oxidoreductase [Candidatus Latescibacterota bacterium]|jgi:FAD/FMN-containing dehydrogenase/Fe-S oxidoreductase